MPPRTYTSEADVKAEVKKLLKAAGIFYFMPNSNGFGRSGAHDFMLVVRGVAVTIETKFGYNKPTVMQRQFAKDVAASGGVPLLVSEKNLSDLEAYINQILERPVGVPNPTESLEFTDAATLTDE